MKPPELKRADFLAADGKAVIVAIDHAMYLPVTSFWNGTWGSLSRASAWS